MQWATGSGRLTFKEIPSKETIDKLNDNLPVLEWADKEVDVEVNGNWWADDVVDVLQEYTDLIEDGWLSFDGDEEGSYRIDFVNGDWTMEHEETYYPSDLPDLFIFPTERVAKIVDTIATDLMCCSDSSHIQELLFDECKLTDKEIKVLGLGWLEDLRKAE